SGRAASGATSPRARRCPASGRRTHAARTRRAPPPECGSVRPSTDKLVETGGTVAPLPDVALTMKARLAGPSVLLTGASGFVGKALLGQILSALPETQVTVLLRGDAEQRLRDQVLTSAPCEGLDGSHVRAISGDVSHDGLGGLGEHDIVIHCAA